MKQPQERKVQVQVLQYHHRYLVGYEILEYYSGVPTMVLRVLEHPRAVNTAN